MTIDSFSLSPARLLLVAAMFLGPGCTTSHWVSPHGLHHPLRGKIWDVNAGTAIDRPTLLNRMAGARYILLGENHDNADHHRLQAELLRQLIIIGRRPAVGFEMLDLDDESTVANYLARSPNDAWGFGDEVGWKQRGWPDWQYYQPIAQVALDAGLHIEAMNLRRSTAETLRRYGVAGLEPELVRELGLDRPIPPDLWKRMADDIRKAHCGYAPDDHLETMIMIQRARDSRMANRMITAGSRDGLVLVAGAGHARVDYGIPTHLKNRAEKRSVVSLAFMEVQEGKTTPKAYASGSGSDNLPFDYVWFTPRRNNLDPCDEFKTQLERLKKKD